jgi:mannitol-1-/sugar-/sorbitol-6-/2-deoxyglucose-6-phosphatase
MMIQSDFEQILSMHDTFIFDMDGLLVDSEPIWKLVEKKVFGQLGITLTDEMLRKVMGFRLSEVVAYWYQYQPWPDADLQQTEKDILAEMVTSIQSHAVAMSGVYELLSFLDGNGKTMALASSSPMILIDAVVDKLSIRKYFQILHSAQFEVHGKPHPAIFIHTAKQLNVSPYACVVFEDSINGVLAAKAARMTCIAVPEVATFDDPRFSIADFKISSLSHLIS